MKPSSSQQGGMRLCAGGGGLLLVVALAALVTLNAAAAADVSKDDVSSDRAALASARREQRLVPVAKRETLVTQHATSTSEQRDLSAGQSIANAKVQMSAQDMQPAAAGHYGGHGKGHGKYYMYAESPKKGAYKAGFKRGNAKHTIERKESQHKSHAHGYMKWHDKKGKGSHKWEYKHSKGKHGHY